ncbi:uncharacterized protein LOC141683443 [Apium graveolens]|uniref:uncharacterized protein LOC141683443 n=1 Tax=Apium graveolens TaxID=4045 RepID=UPI003D7B7CC9
MNTSQYMDKQIMDLSNSQTDFINLNQQHDQNDDDYKKEEIVPNYDFQPIRSSNITDSTPPRVWTSADSKINSAVSRNYASLDSNELAKVSSEKDRNVYNAALLSEIDKTMKKHNDNLLHALEGVSARLSQLESRNRNLENSLDDLKLSVGNNYGSTDGKLRQLENILRDVETAVHDVKDKQEILEAQLQLAKLQVSKEQQVEKPSPVNMDVVHQAASAPQQQLPPFTQPPPHSLPNAPLPPQQNLPSPPQPPPHQFSQNQISHAPQQDMYYPPSVQTPEAPTQQYLLPQQQQQQPPPTSTPPQQQYQPSSLPLYSQPPAPQQHPFLAAINAPQSQPQLPLGHQPEEAPFLQPSQNHQQITHQPPSNLPGGVPPPQQFYGTPSNMYEPQPGRTGPGYSVPYGPSSGPSDPYPYGGPTSPYGRGAPAKSQQLHSPSIGHSGGNSYQLPTARILPQALPTATNVNSGSNSSGNGNKLPIDDVVDKVATMGFPRDQVRATVRRLTENGQSVDLNVVLDKLMNDSDVQPPRGWLNR